MNTHVIWSLGGAAILLVAGLFTASWLETYTPPTVTESAPDDQKRGDTPALDPRTQTTLHIGQTHTLSDRVSFAVDEVLEDSRCPTDTQCIDAGTFAVAMEITDGSDTTIERVTRGDTFSLSSYTVTLVDVYPPAYDFRDIQPIEYRITYDIRQ